MIPFKKGYLYQWEGKKCQIDISMSPLLYLPPFPCKYRASHKRCPVAKSWHFLLSSLSSLNMFRKYFWIHRNGHLFLGNPVCTVRVYNTYFSASSNKILKQDFLGSKILNFETGRFDPGWITFVFKPGNELYYYALKNCKIPPGESEKERERKRERI